MEPLHGLVFASAGARCTRRHRGRVYLDRLADRGRDNCFHAQRRRQGQQRAEQAAPRSGRIRMSLLALLHIACLALLAVLLIGAGAQDWRSMHIANGFPLAIAGLFIVWAIVDLSSGHLSLTALGMAVACGVVVFAAGAAVFAVGALGGGDVKLLA